MQRQYIVHHSHVLYSTHFTVIIKGFVVLVGFIAGKVHLDHMVSALSSRLLSRVLDFNRLEWES